MEDIKNMQSKKMNDDDLEQVSGGGKLWDLFTTEIREFFDGSEDSDDPGKVRERRGQFGIGTLEMRVNPNENRRIDDDAEYIKL